MKPRRREKEKDLDRELRAHLELEAEEQRERGFSAGEAKHAAQRALGNTTLLKEEVREVWGWNWANGIARDFRYCLRQLRRNPGFGAVMIATLALGIGANTAIFGILRAVLLRSLPYRAPDQLVAVWEKDTERQTKEKVSGGDYSDWKAQNHVFEDWAYSWDTPYTLTDSGNPQTLAGYQFSPNFFSLLGALPLLGRTFEAEEGEPGRDRVAVLSYHLWASTFRSDKSIVGGTIRLDGSPYVVLGVMPKEFGHPNGNVDLWTPLPFPSGLAQNRGFHVFQVLGRLKPMVSLAQAQHEMDALARQSMQEHPKTNLHIGVDLEPIRETYVGNVRAALWVLQIAVFIMLLIACGNVANMLLARASSSEREIALRLSLGAGRKKVLRQFLVQGLVMSGSGATIGLGLAFWGVRVLPRLFRDQLGGLPLPSDAAGWIDWPVLSFAVVTGFLVGTLFGVVPVMRKGRPSLEALRASSRGATEGPGSIRLRDLLIVGQVALSLVLLIGAGLLIESFVRLENQPLGFQSHQVLSFALSFPPNRYAGLAQTAPFLEQTVTRIRAVPGVESAAAISTLPLTGMDARRPYANPDEPTAEPQMAQYRVITPDYFRVMQIPLKSGRLFRDADRRGSPDVVIVNERFARQLWPRGDAVGKLLNLADLARIQPMQVVGVVGDVRHDGLGTGPPIEVYRPAYQTSWPFVGVVVRTTLEPELIAKSVREAVWAVDRDLPINRLESMDDLAADSIALRRSTMLLVSAFAALAIFLAFLGIYSVISYGVTLRTHEIGVRMALGATTGEMVGMILRHCIVLTLTGIAIGLLGALSVTRFLTAVLFGVSATDAGTLVLAMTAMAAVAITAAYVPARRASLVDPMVALRYE